jgi:hypothetical protein
VADKPTARKVETLLPIFESVIGVDQAAAFQIVEAVELTVLERADFGYLVG